MAKEDLKKAQKGKNDEFYTQFPDIQKEINAYLEYNLDVFRNKTVLCPCDDPEWSNFTKFFAQNFETLGLKKLISTSYATTSKSLKSGYQFSNSDFLTDYEKESLQYDENKTENHGKIFILEKDVNGNGKIDIDDLEWSYLEGDGDFRSDEVKALRDEADIIVTNPPFSLFIDFIEWIYAANKKFLVLGNQNAITYKEVFEKIKNNKMWIGTGLNMSVVYKTPYINEVESNRNFVIKQGYDPDDGYVKVPGIGWFTNIEHGRRHKPMELMSMSDNIKFNKPFLNLIQRKYGLSEYPVYDNYNAIEVPMAKAIPNDYMGIMGVPITFLDKYCPEQFEILGITDRQQDYYFKTKVYTKEEYKNANDLNRGPVIMGKNNMQVVYTRIFIRRVQDENNTNN